MKKFLHLYLGLQIFAAIVNFIAFLQVSFVYAIILAAINLLGVIIPIAILKNIDEIDNMKSELFWLRSDLRQLERDINGEKNSENGDETAQNLKKEEFAIGTWKCIKCGTVNKQNTSHCSNCKAAYSSHESPTSDPTKPKKLNRWGI